MKNSSLKYLSLILAVVLLASVTAVFHVEAAGPWLGYVKPSYTDYAPSGVPDFDEKQDQWGPAQGTYTWCVPVAVANSLWWLDSEYESVKFANPVPPPTISDHFSLVNSSSQQFDDHDPQNVAGLVTNLAVLMDTDGIRTGDHHVGTRLTDIQTGIQQYLIQQGVANLFEVHNFSFPDFAWIDTETQKCQDVELFLEFWQQTGPGWTNLTISNPSLEFGHCVTCAGSNVTTSQLLICDPYQDAYEAGSTSGRAPVMHAYPHNSGVHNDAQYVSQDAYTVAPVPLGGPPPPGYPGIVWELQGYLQTLGYDPSYHAFIRAAIATSGLPDIAVTNVTTCKTRCKPMPTVCQNYTCHVNVTVANNGPVNETFGVTVYGNATYVLAKQNVTLASWSTANITLVWNTTTWLKGNYTISAGADVVSGETNVANNNFTDSWIKVVIVGDVNGDGKVNVIDVFAVSLAYGSYPGHPAWNPNYDINDDHRINLIDYFIAALNYGKTDP